MITETWANQYSDVNVENFEHFVLNRLDNKSTATRSSGGIIIYVRNEFVTKDTLVFHSCDNVICIKIAGSNLGLQHDLCVCLCFVVPENSSRQAFIESHTYDRLLDNIISLQSKYDSNFYFFLCGDMNSHTVLIL